MVCMVLDSFDTCSCQIARGDSLITQIWSNGHIGPLIGHMSGTSCTDLPILICVISRVRGASQRFCRDRLTAILCLKSSGAAAKILEWEHWRMDRIMGLNTTILLLKHANSTTTAETVSCSRPHVTLQERFIVSNRPMGQVERSIQAQSRGIFDCD